jgi:arylsulfatase A-like enzyme
LSTRHQARSCQEFLEKAKAEASNPAMGFVFLHAPIPHAPHAYDRHTGKFDGKNNPLGGYPDSLALMDRALSEIRQEMEKSGQWERTALIASSDHPYRTSEAFDGKSDPRIPFLLKFPGETKAVTYTGQFNTIVTADLVLSILRGQVSNVAEALAWLEQHRQYSEDPVPAGN